MSDPISLGTMTVLALIDSTSFGTLLFPIWLLMSPGRVRVGRVLLFLGTVAWAYFGIGLAVLLGASAFLDAFGAVFETKAFRVAQLVLGIALVVVSYLMDNKHTRWRAAEQAASGGGRIASWRARAVGEGAVSGGATAALLGLAVTAVLAEVATMIPYLAAIGIIATRAPASPATPPYWPGTAPS